MSPEEKIEAAQKLIDEARAEIADDVPEPTGAELVGKVCVYVHDDGRTYAGRVCEVYEPGRGYSWGTRATWYKHARLA